MAVVVHYSKSRNALL